MRLCGALSACLLFLLFRLDRDAHGRRRQARDHHPDHGRMRARFESHHVTAQRLFRVLFSSEGGQSSSIYSHANLQRARCAPFRLFKHHRVRLTSRGALQHVNALFYSGYRLGGARRRVGSSRKSRPPNQE